MSAGDCPGLAQWVECLHIKKIQFLSLVLDIFLFDYSIFHRISGANLKCLNKNLHAILISVHKISIKFFKIKKKKTNSQFYKNTYCLLRQIAKTN